MSAVLGVVCALLSPLFMVCGFLLWESQWKGDAVELNIFKCAFASLLFSAACAITQGGFGRLDDAGADSKGFLVLSSVLGICLGDVAWLMALKAIGARRAILVDALGPPMAAVLAHFFLGDRVGAIGYVGMAITIVGVAVAALERERGTGATETSVLSKGYVLALINVTLDSLGSLLTKAYGGLPLNAFDIGLLRFGSAAAIMGAFYAVKLAAFGCPLREGQHEKPRSEESGGVEEASPDDIKCRVAEEGSKEQNGHGRGGGRAEELPTAIEASHEWRSQRSTLDSTALCMTRRQRLFTAFAVSLVAFTCPSLKHFGCFPREEQHEKPQDENGEEASRHRQESGSVDDVSPGDIKCRVAEEGSKERNGGAAEMEGKADERANGPSTATEALCERRSALDTTTLCMTRRQWLFTALAVSLVTFTCPSLKNFAMFQISLAATATLTSLGPLYSIPLVVLVKGERVSWRSIAASFAAVGGVAMLVSDET